MIIDEIKAGNIQAMKEKNMVARNIYSILLNKHLQATIDSRTSGKPVEDADMVRIIQKTIKELDEEAENYKKVGNMEEYKTIEEQKALISKYLPQLLGEDEIRKIILSLEDKTVPSVMRHFKTNYNGKVDMKTVSDVLKTL